MLTFVVMPCLNEASYVEETIRSLLAPAHAEAPDVQLIAVDNGSTDATLAILGKIALRHRGQVHLVEEARRGFVPARRRGIAAAVEISARRSVAPNDVLVLQADADTVYKSGYVAAMQSAAGGVDNVILEGATRRPPAFIIEHAEYVAAERLVDASLEHFEAADEDDVVVDDKICAYRLSDYLRWGGLFEESDSFGDAIDAETTRLFIRARLATGARKLRVNPAGAASSRRRVMEDPRYQFATMGFPRSHSWQSKLGARWSSVTVDEFARSILAGGEKEVVALRRAHLLALFRYLPAVILSGGSSASELLEQDDVRTVLDHLPRRTRDDLSNRPGLAVTDVLELIDLHPEIFQKTI